MTHPDAPRSWKPIETAPKDGTLIWAWLYHKGAHLMRWETADEVAAQEGGSPDEYEEGWIDIHQPSEHWYPKFWLPKEALPEPPETRVIGERAMRCYEAKPRCS
jgi:hypothetical protein